MTIYEILPKKYHPKKQLRANKTENSKSRVPPESSANRQITTSGVTLSIGPKSESITKFFKCEPRSRIFVPKINVYFGAGHPRLGVPREPHPLEDSLACEVNNNGPCAAGHPVHWRYVGEMLRYILYSVRLSQDRQQETSHYILDLV